MAITKCNIITINTLMKFNSSNQRLQNLYILVVGFGLTWMNYTYAHDHSYLILLFLNLAVILGCAPLYFWIQNTYRESIPLLPMHALFYALAFGLAGFKQPGSIALNSWNLDIQSNLLGFALICVITGLLTLYIAYFLVAPMLEKYCKPIPTLHLKIKNNNVYTWLIFGGYPCICFLYWYSRQGVMASLTLTFQTISQFIFYLLVAAYFQRKLNTSMRVALLCLIFPYQFFIASGFLEGSIGPLLLNLLAICIIYFAINKKIPWGWMILIICTIFLIQPIKGDLRKQIWQLRSDGMTSELKQGSTVVDSMQKLSKIFSAKYFSRQGAQEVMSGEIVSASHDRINRLRTLIEVISLTPNPQPYRYGSTYLPLLTKWIPRLFWENKPREDLGNEWSRVYGLSPPDDFAYSYNLPWIAEMYMNFGFPGIIGVSFLIGLLVYILKKVFCEAGNDPGSLALGVVLLTPLMMPESHFSLLIGGVIIGTIPIVLVLYLSAKAFPKYFSLKLMR